MKKTLLLVASVVLALVASACGSVRPYAAKVKVNGKTTVVATADLDAELNAIRGNKAYFAAIKSSATQQGGQVEGVGSNTFDAAFVAQILNRRVLVALVRRAIDDNHLKITAGDRSASRTSLVQQFTQTDANGSPAKDGSLFTKFDRSYQDDLVESNAAVTVLRDWLSTRASEASVRKYYNEHAKEFEETCVRHVLVKEKSTADDVHTKLVSGQDFVAIAKAVSTDPSAAQGGDLGCLTTAESTSLDPAFLAAMSKLAPGEFSVPVQTQFGWHVIQVTKRQPRALDSALQQQIAGTLGDISTFVRDLITKAKVTVNPRYGSFDKKDFAGVVPPKAPATSTTAPLGLGGATPGSPTG